MKRTVKLIVVFIISLLALTVGIKKTLEANIAENNVNYRYELATVYETRDNVVAFIDEGGDIWEVYGDDVDITETYVLEINTMDEITDFYEAD